MTAYAQVVLLVVGLLAVGAVVLARRRGRGVGPFSRAGRVPLRVEAVQTLGPRHRVMLVECEGRRYLLGLGAESVTVIDRLAGTAPRPDEVADRA